MVGYTLCHLRRVLCELTLTARASEKYNHHLLVINNDPSAGSPTDALLRLLFPLNLTV